MIELNGPFVLICLKKNSQTFEKPEFDLFATRLNAKSPVFCSWKPEPNSYLVDAFTTDWSVFSGSYLFPPFSMLGRCVHKIS